jgi:anti-anti-sigma factor
MLPDPTDRPSSSADWIIVQVGGPDLDIATSPTLSAQLDDTRKAHPDAGIVVDLSAVTFMDCSGLRPLVRSRRDLGGNLMLRGLQPEVARLMDLVDLSRTFRIDAGPAPAASTELVGGSQELNRPLADSGVGGADASPGGSRRHSPGARDRASLLVRWAWPTWAIIGERVRSVPPACGARPVQDPCAQRVPPPRRWRSDRYSSTPSQTALPHSPAIRSADGLTSFVGLLLLNGTLIATNIMGPGAAAHLNVDDTLGRQLWQASWWSFNPTAQHDLREALTFAATGHLVRYEQSVRINSGQLVTFDFTVIPVSSHGAVTGLVFSAIDISDQHLTDQRDVATSAYREDTVSLPHCSSAAR